MNKKLPANAFRLHCKLRLISYQEKNKGRGIMWRWSSSVFNKQHHRTIDFVVITKLLKMNVISIDLFKKILKKC